MAESSSIIGQNYTNMLNIIQKTCIARIICRLAKAVPYRGLGYCNMLMPKS